MRADIHGGPEQKLQSEAGYIDARPQTENLLQRTAGPYIGSIATGSALLGNVRLLPVFPQFQTYRCTALTDAMRREATSRALLELTEAANIRERFLRSSRSFVARR